MVGTDTSIVVKYQQKIGPIARHRECRIRIPPESESIIDVSKNVALSVNHSDFRIWKSPASRGLPESPDSVLHICLQGRQCKVVDLARRADYAITRLQNCGHTCLQLDVELPPTVCGVLNYGICSSPPISG